MSQHYITNCVTFHFGRQEGHPACKETVLACLFVGGDDLKLCMCYSSSCHHSPPPSPLAPIKSRGPIYKRS